jgi:hypothetical protein
MMNEPDAPPFRDREIEGYVLEARVCKTKQE